MVSKDKQNGKVTITLVRSTSGRLRAHKACVSGLGLRRIHQTISVDDTPYNRGMINAVSYLLKVEEA
jgi:large subunit ribosomal protein L30